MYFWNVVLSYVRKDNFQNRERIDHPNDIELAEQLDPDSRHKVIYKHVQKSKINQNKKSSGRQKQSNTRAPRHQEQRHIQGSNSTHYYQTPADQRNYHML